jgi:hypothetical protein
MDLQVFADVLNANRDCLFKAWICLIRCLDRVLILAIFV